MERWVVSGLQAVNYVLVDLMTIWLAHCDQRGRSRCSMAIITLANEDDADQVMDVCWAWRFPVDAWIEGRREEDGTRLANVKWFDPTYADRKARERSTWGYKPDWANR